MKSIELTTTQIKAHEAGATMIIVPIDTTEHILSRYESKEQIIKELSTIQKGDKDVYIKEEFKTLTTMKNGTSIIYKSEDCDWFNFQPAKDMTKEQSRYTISECIDVELGEVEKVVYGDMDKILGTNLKRNNGIIGIGNIKKLSEKFEEFYKTQLKEQKINSTYIEDIKNNKHIFLIEIKNNG